MLLHDLKLPKYVPGDQNVPASYDDALDPESGRVRERQIVTTSAHRLALKSRKATARISEADQIRFAIEAYLRREPHPQDRNFLLAQAPRHRKLVPIADQLWDELRERKDRTGLDLDEQVQIALALYFQSHDKVQRPEAGAQMNTALQFPGIRRASDLLLAAQENASSPHAPSSLLTSGLQPLASKETDPLLVAARIVLSNAALEAAQGSSIVPLISLPAVPCGPWREAINEGTTLSLPRELAEILGARAGDWLVPTDGQSMIEAGVPDGGRVVMRPLNGRRPQLGEVVLCCIERADGQWQSTLKFWFETPRGAPLLRNGKSEEIVLPADTIEVHPVAVLIGVMGRATFGTPKGPPVEARTLRQKRNADADDSLAE